MGAEPTRPPCERCGGLVEWEICEGCEGTGETEPGELHGLDPECYGEDEVESCHTCDGHRGAFACVSCGEYVRQG